MVDLSHPHHHHARAGGARTRGRSSMLLSSFILFRRPPRFICIMFGFVLLILHTHYYYRVPDDVTSSLGGDMPTSMSTFHDFKKSSLNNNKNHNHAYSSSLSKQQQLLKKHHEQQQQNKKEQPPQPQPQLQRKDLQQQHLSKQQNQRHDYEQQNKERRPQQSNAVAVPQGDIASLPGTTSSENMKSSEKAVKGHGGRRDVVKNSNNNNNNNNTTNKIKKDVPYKHKGIVDKRKTTTTKTTANTAEAYILDTLKAGNHVKTAQRMSRTTTTTTTNKRAPRQASSRADKKNPLYVAANYEKRFGRSHNSHSTQAASNTVMDGFITRNDSIKGDPLRDPNWNNATKAKANQRLPFKPKTKYLGVLVDAGRHYFPIPWLYNLMDRLADMRYNLIHLRLTDDQAWNVLLEHTPSLAYPSHVDNPDLRVYTVPELRALVKYAKKKGIAIMPEVNVPGHGGAWAAALNGTAIVQCPKFICEKGYGVPINVTNPALFPLLETILREIIDIFDDPPFLHLGGDEVNMAGPCFREVDRNGWLPNFQDFENKLRKVVEKIGYPNDRIVRWEMTGQDEDLDRVGAVEQFWFSLPGQRHEANNKSGFMYSTHMYFDTNGEDDATKVYYHAARSFHLPQGNDTVPTAIVAGTFELSPAFWFDRNILGRLLAVAMGAAEIHLEHNITWYAGKGGGNDDDFYNDDFPEPPKRFDDDIYYNNYDKPEPRLINKVFKKYCHMLGLGPTICDNDGKPVIPTTKYKAKWNRAWTVWKTSICNRLADTHTSLSLKNLEYQTKLARTAALDFFTDNYAALPGANEDDKKKPPTTTRVAADGSLPSEWDGLRGHDKEKVPEFAGVIFDLTTSEPDVIELGRILQDVVAKVGLNTVQLRLAGKTGGWFSYESHDLEDIDTKASELGLHVIPEISASSDANGYYPMGLVAKCPTRFCRQGVPLDITKSIVPLTVFSLVGMLREDFPSSRFLQLGSDERQDSLPCFAADRKTANVSMTDFEAYEYRLTRLLQLGDTIDMNRILRWDNAEHKRYTHRTGNITQYRSGTDISKIRRNDGPFFVTVDLLKMTESAWALYSHTRVLVDTKPMGIMADVGTISFEGWNEWDLPQRILAFSMAVSELPVILSESEFTNIFILICKATLALESCTPPAALSTRHTLHPPSKNFTKFAASNSAFAKQCKAATFTISRHVLKRRPTSPFYNVTAKQLLLEQASKAIW